MSEILFSKIYPNGKNLKNIKISQKDVKYAKIGSTLIYDTFSHYNYDTPNISVSYKILSRNGGSVIPTITYTQKRWKVGYSGAVYTSDTISGNVTSFTASGNEKNFSGAIIKSNTGEVSRKTLGTTYKDSNWVIMDVTISCVINGKEGSKTVSVYMESNTYTDSGGQTTYYDVVAGTINNATIPAYGGTGIATASNGSQYWSKTAKIRTYQTKATETLENAGSGSDTIIPNHSSIDYTGANLGSNPTDIVTLRSQEVIWKGNGGKSASGTMYIYQEANVATITSYINILNLTYEDALAEGEVVSPNFEIDGKYITSYTSKFTIEHIYSKQDLTLRWNIIDGIGAIIERNGDLIWEAHTNNFERSVTVQLEAKDWQGNVQRITTIAKQVAKIQGSIDMYVAVGKMHVPSTKYNEAHDVFTYTTIIPSITNIDNDNDIITVTGDFLATFRDGSVIAKRLYLIDQAHIGDLKMLWNDHERIGILNDFATNLPTNTYQNFIGSSGSFTSFQPKSTFNNCRLENIQCFGVPENVKVNVILVDPQYARDVYCPRSREHYGVLKPMMDTNSGITYYGVPFYLLPSTFMSEYGCTKGEFVESPPYYQTWYTDWYPGYNDFA